jgi:hypothetical protein
MRVTAMLGKLAGKAREYEKQAVQVRKFAGLSPYVRLDPFGLAGTLGMKVVGVRDVVGISDELAQRLLVGKSSEWSGASSGVLVDGTVIVVLNEAQSPQRRAATLMEEICHVLLGHQPNRLNLDAETKREYHRVQESEAYGVGAAALVPYAGLVYFRQQGWNVSELAQHYGVTTALVDYRVKFTHQSSQSS